MVALIFSVLFIWYSRNTGHDFWVYRAQRDKMTAPPPIPPYRA